MRLPTFLCALLLASLSACAVERQSERSPLPPSVPTVSCQTAWVYAPGNYIIDIAAGADVLLNPEVQDFPLFCTPEEALVALGREIDAGRLPRGDWRAYKLEGTFSDIAERDGTGQVILARMTRLQDWL